MTLFPTTGTRVRGLGSPGINSSAATTKGHGFYRGWQPLPRPSTGRSRGRGRKGGHLPRRTRPKDRLALGQETSHCRRRTLHPRLHPDLLQDPDARFHDLGLDHVSRHTCPDASKRCHVRQLEAFGYTVTLAPGV
jgi:transposase